MSEKKQGSEAKAHFVIHVVEVGGVQPLTYNLSDERRPSQSKKDTRYRVR
jgi:hypothetical protein